jgi:plastocyanin
MKLLLLVLFLFFVGTVIRPERQEISINEEPTGSVRGKIEINAMNKEESSQRSPRHHAYGMPSMTSHTSEAANEFANVVVCLEGKKLQAMSTSAHSHAVMDQRDAEFIPHVLPVQRGTVVDFINRDNVYHNVFSLSPAKKFNIGRRPTGQAVPITFDKPGVVEVFCDIHSNMSAYIFVMENELFAQPDKKGNYSIDHVPAGTYTIKVWHERFGNLERTISITADSTTTANFILE